MSSWGSGMSAYMLVARSCLLFLIWYRAIISQTRGMSMYAYINTHMYKYIPDMYIHVYIYIYLCIYKYVYMMSTHIYIYVCINIYLYMY